MHGPPTGSAMPPTPARGGLPRRRPHTSHARLVRRPWPGPRRVLAFFFLFCFFAVEEGTGASTSAAAWGAMVRPEQVSGAKGERASPSVPTPILGVHRGSGLPIRGWAPPGYQCLDGLR